MENEIRTNKYHNRTRGMLIIACEERDSEIQLLKEKVRGLEQSNFLLKEDIHRLEIEKQALYDQQ
jgi:hypothetical protein